MLLPLPSAACDFLQHYAYDAQLRWSPDDFLAQQKFVARQTEAKRWADWSTSSAALQLLQGGQWPAAIGVGGPCETILLAGPMAELWAAEDLLCCAVEQLQPVGQVVGIIPCLRDNSPESQMFMKLTGATLWAYQTAEELLEIIGEAGLTVSSEPSGFVAVPRFNEAVQKDELRFKGFHEVFLRLEAEGYDPMEVGWGELRFVAECPNGS
ncbi:MAG: hypothetical protein HY735_05730 [Verrucomicrobia bacterium]|nr:hypothetical protein [Verrucomicrobiota bacterium]